MGDSLSTFKGPRKIVTARISADSVLVLEAVAATKGVSRSALLTRLLESYTDAWLREHSVEIGLAVAKEKQRRGVAAAGEKP